MDIGVNRRYEATTVDVTATLVAYNFKTFRFPYIGLILLKLPAYTAPGTAVPVVAEFENALIPIIGLGNAALTSDTLNKSGVYLAFYENNQIQVLSNVQ